MGIVTDLEFVDELPPRPERRNRGLVEMKRIAAELRRNPNRWAVVYRGPTPNAARVKASQIRGGRTATFGLGFDAEAREIDGKQVVFAKFIEAAS